MGRSSRGMWVGLNAVLFTTLLSAIAGAHPGHLDDPSPTDSGLRTWNVSGENVPLEAWFLLTRGGDVHLQDRQGREIVLKLTEFSAADQEWLRGRTTKLRILNLDASPPESIVRPLMFAQLPAADPPTRPAPQAAKAFDAFAKTLTLHWDENFLFVESNGLPDHRMMVGITAWQQQVPLPQPYTGANAWRVPLHPVVAKSPLSAKSHFFRGAIALAANGVPIFNPIKNDGHTDTLLAGELDEFGGHCGRADDYHYHTAPVHLEKLVGAGQPIAFALDGYPIYGLTEPDGSPVAKLDGFNGHADAKGNYHYHATKAYPYLNGGFHGEVTERGGQVDPQPRAQPVRPDLPPLRGATITEFTTAPGGKAFDLKYDLRGASAAVHYEIPDGGDVYRFRFTGTDGAMREETYRREDRPNRGGGGDDRRPPADRRR